MNRLPTAASISLAAAVLACALLSACKTKEHKLSDDPLPYPDEEQAHAGVTTYSKNLLSGWPKGREMDPHDISRVRFGEQVHSYHIGRLPSKDRREMHEAHTVYRLEQSARWDTRLPATPMDSHGVILGIVEPSRKEIPDDTVIQQERTALADKAAAMRKSMAELDLLRAQLLQKKAAYEQAEKDVTDIKAYLEKTLQERAALDAQLKQANARIEELEEAERFRIRSSNQSLVPKK